MADKDGTTSSNSEQKEEKVEVSSPPSESETVEERVGEETNSSSSDEEESENYNLDMGSSLLASIEKLRGRENYSTWKFAMENYLAASSYLIVCVSMIAARSIRRKAKAHNSNMMAHWINPNCNVFCCAMKRRETSY